jgi:hypothetical protein
MQKPNQGVDPVKIKLKVLENQERLNQVLIKCIIKDGAYFMDLLKYFNRKVNKLGNATSSHQSKLKTFTKQLQKLCQNMKTYFKYKVSAKEQDSILVSFLIFMIMKGMDAYALLKPNQ